jgi:hypothetical protein
MPGHARRARVGDDSLLNAAEVVLDRLAVACCDSVLVLCSPEREALAKLVAARAGLRTQTVEVLAFAPGTRDGAEPPPSAAAAWRRASAVILLTRHSLSHTRARLHATRTGARSASLPGISEER